MSGVRVLNVANPCCNCGKTEARPWPDDPSYPMCTNPGCMHVCAHSGVPFRWADDNRRQP